MKILATALALTICHLNASEFLSPDDLVKSLLDVPATGKAVGTFFATNIDTQTAEDCAKFKTSTSTCFAIGTRHLLTGSHTLDLIGGDLKDCFVSMVDIICEDCVLSPTFKGPRYQKVKNITREPNGANLAIVELYEDLGVTPLALGKFNSGVATGISTAVPTLAGIPGGPDKWKHTFSYGGFSAEEEAYLEAWFVVPTTVTADDIRSHAITSAEITRVGYGCTSLLTHGDDGAPLLQGDEVVAVCDGWRLSKATVCEKPMHLLANKFTIVEPYIPWIKSIVSPKKDAEEAKEKEKL